MFMEVGAPHHRPHFHAVYQDAKAVFAIDPIECIAGGLPQTQQRLVEAWAEIHREELQQARGASCNSASLRSRSTHYAERGTTMSHAIHRVEHFEIVGPYTLALRFDDGTNQRIDFQLVLEGEVFAPLRDLKLFNAVELDPTFGTIQWPIGADFDPETLHNWPKYRDDLVAMARQWAETTEPAHRTAG